MADRGKRGRQSAAEPWRDLARTVPGVLLRLATSESEALLSSVASTHQRLRTHTTANLLQTFLAARGGTELRPPPGRSAKTSRREVERLAEVHDSTGYVFALCAARLGLITEGGHGVDAETQARWQAWLGHRTEAARHAADAQRRLHSAMACLGAALRVLLLVAERLPDEPSPRLAWASATDRLLRHAAGEAAAAREPVLRMRHAVFLEFFGAWMVLSRLDARGRA